MPTLVLAPHPFRHRTGFLIRPPQRSRVTVRRRPSPLHGPASHAGGQLRAPPREARLPPPNAHRATGASCKSAPRALPSALAGSARGTPCRDGWEVGFCGAWAQAPSSSRAPSGPGEVVLAEAGRGLTYCGPSTRPKPWVYVPPPAHPAAEWTAGCSPPEACSGVRTAHLSR